VQGVKAAVKLPLEGVVDGPVPGQPGHSRERG
jgi:hypothetical protein